MPRETRLYFTIGPVQAFVAKSRRTRDLWASSFLLSYLADEAMKAVENHGGEIVLPDRLLQAEAVPHGQVLHGRWPNRFVAKVDNPQAAAEAAKTAFLQAWAKIADRVWEKYVRPVVANSKRVAEAVLVQKPRSDHFDYEAKAIWSRQVDHFWEIGWVAGPPPQPGRPDPLVSRKNWRTTPVTVEPGDHCTMMGSWQEISGFIRSRKRSRQDEFWNSLRSRLGQLDLGEDERLCAIALIKRMFPQIAKQTIGTDLNAESWLSTPYIAAIPWLKRVCHIAPGPANTYLNHIQKHRQNWRRENPSTVLSLQPLLEGACPDILRLDADFLHDTALRNASETPLDRVDQQLPQSARTERNLLLHELEKLYQAMDGEKPSSFYAMLLMDGDSVGHLLAKARREAGDKGEQSVTEALGQFADAVPRTVGQHDGVTVYCGGDDVLAMLPVHSVLQCAQSLYRLYQKKFKDKAQAFAEKATISAGIVFCPFRAPLPEVIELAHHLLDNVAKAATGRDSLAAAVLKSGGVTCQWAAPWTHVANDDETVLDALVERLHGHEGQKGELSTSFLFQIRERFAVLTNNRLASPGRFGRVPDGIDVKALLLGEFRRARSHLTESQAKLRQNDATNTIELLMQVCRRVHRTGGVDPNSLGIDGPLLVRFLAGETREPTGKERAQ